MANRFFGTGSKLSEVAPRLLKAYLVCSSFKRWIGRLHVIVLPETDWADFKGPGGLRA